MEKEDIKFAVIFGGIGIIFALIAFAVKSTAAKWIWGVLAIGIIIFTIYATIDTIVKSKRRSKDLFKILEQAMEEEAEKPDFIQRMKTFANRRDILYDGQRPNDSDYGYSTSNPIMTSTISDSDKYLRKLRTHDGKPFTWNRGGSICMEEVHGVSNVMIDVYTLFLNGQEYKKIYICPYGHTSNYVPEGLMLVD